VLGNVVREGKVPRRSAFDLAPAQFRTGSLRRAIGLIASLVVDRHNRVFQRLVGRCRPK
jgi:hypothetical protein